MLKRIQLNAQRVPRTLRYARYGRSQPENPAMAAELLAILKNWPHRKNLVVAVCSLPAAGFVVGAAAEPKMLLEELFDNLKPGITEAEGQC